MYNIQEIENTWISMPDGVFLAARLWIPENANENPVPCILEYIPYRKRDFTSIRDEGHHKYFAEKGYACIRVDMRGSGDSEGVLKDEYLPLEQEDGIAIIDWIDQQDWCDGNVGVIGISWGGITSLQIATRRPKALKAIVPVGASIDRYYDDGGYFAGAYCGQTIGWGALMFAINTYPPDPLLLDEEEWANQWRRRLEETPLFLSIWLHHPRRDDYWLQGTVKDRFDEITCPIYVVNGWNDCWPNTVLRVMSSATSPVWGMSGAWGHNYPYIAFPGPGMNFLDEVCLFWDHNLKGLANDFDRQPPLHLYIQTEVPTEPKHSHRPGYWVAESGWPSPNVETENWFFGNRRLQKQPFTAGEENICSGLHTGFCSGEYMPMPQDPELEQMPMDQLPDEDQSLVYVSEIFSSSTVILGTPVAFLRVKSDQNCGLVAARLCDEAPDGSISLLTYGVLNLAQRSGRETPSSVEAHKYYDLTIALNDLAYEIQPQHRLRLSLSTNYFPLAWPLPENATLTVNCEASRLDLPFRQKPEHELPVSKTFLSPPKAADLDPRQELSPVKSQKQIEHLENESIMRISTTGARICNLNTNWTYGRDTEQIFTVDQHDPLKTSARYQTNTYFKRENFCAGSHNTLNVTCDSKNFIIEAQTRVYLNGDLFFKRNYHEYIDRSIF